jgi:ATP-dependent Clp protease adaptor protein ClpS
MVYEEGSGAQASGSAEAVEESEVPPDYKVIFYNDDYTTKEFVVEILEQIFHKNTSDAVAIMEKVHTTGSAVVGVYTYDIAVTRAQLTIDAARENGFPLRCDCMCA